MGSKSSAGEGGRLSCGLSLISTCQLAQSRGQFIWITMQSILRDAPKRHHSMLYSFRKYTPIITAQVVLESSQLKALAPGCRRLELARKPASELRSSAQEHVQGTLELSLETPWTAAAVVDGALSSPASIGSLANPARRAEGGALGNVEAASKSQGEKRDQAVDVEKSGETGDKLFEGVTANAASDQAYWEGVSWAQDHAGEFFGAESLGTFEVASNTRDKIGQEDNRVAESEDLLICVKGATGLTEVSVSLRAAHLARSEKAIR